MTRLVVGTDSVETSERLLTYLRETIDEDDEIYVINSHVGGDETDADEVVAGEEAAESLYDGLQDVAQVEDHQYVRGNAPVEDLLSVADEWDADEFVIGIRKRSPVGKMVFGSTAQNLLLEAERPVRCVPLVSG